MSPSTATRSQLRADPSQGPQFGTFAEYLAAVKRDARELAPFAAATGAYPVPWKLAAQLFAAAGSDEHGTYSDPHGGFSVPRSIAVVADRTSEQDPTAARVSRVPMPTPAVTVVARVSENHSTSVSGGFKMTRKAETTPAVESRAELDGVALKVSTLIGITHVSEEWAQDTGAVGFQLIEAGYRLESNTEALRGKISGLGGNEYLGVLNSGATIEVAKEGGQTADTISATNVKAMVKRLWGAGIWLANFDTREQLGALADVGLYQYSRVEGQPDSMSGFPVFYTEHAPALGDRGDVILANWSQYLEGVYQPFTWASSIHVRWQPHERTFKFFERAAAAPWWRVPLTPKNGANTLSPFVVLAART